MPRFQFSLKWLMVAITIVCVLLFLSVTIREFIGIALTSLVWCVLPTPLIIFAIYGREDRQAFAIGALVPWLTLVIFRVPAYTSLFSATIWLLPMSVICAAVATMTRRWIQPNHRD